MSERPLVSVIVPVYNAEKYLRECLESIRNQTLDNLEVICVNDGSTDGSLGILKEYAKKDKRFHIINQKNKGVNIARSAGYQKARGEYIAWADNDDILDKKMYEEMYRLAREKGSDIVICNYNLYPKSVAKKEVWYKPYVGKHDWRFIARNTTLWNKIVRKDLLDKLDIVGLFNQMGESAYSIVLAASDKVATTDKALYNYRVGHGSVSSTYDSTRWYMTTVASTKAKYDYAVEHKLPTEFRDYFYYCYLYYNLVLMSVAARNGEKQLYNETKKVVTSSHFFSKKNQMFFKVSLSLPKRCFFRYCIYPNYEIAKIIAKRVLR